MASDTWQDNEPSQRAHESLGYEVVDRVVTFRKSLLALSLVFALGANADVILHNVTVIDGGTRTQSGALASSPAAAQASRACAPRGGRRDAARAAAGPAALHKRTEAGVLAGCLCSVPPAPRTVAARTPALHLTRFARCLAALAAFRVQPGFPLRAGQRLVGVLGAEPERRLGLAVRALQAQQPAFPVARWLRGRRHAGAILPHIQV
jgi:hypothetical protein